MKSSVPRKSHKLDRKTRLRSRRSLSMQGSWRAPCWAFMCLPRFFYLETGLSCWVMLLGRSYFYIFLKWEICNPHPHIFLDCSQHVHLLHAGARKTLRSLGRSLYSQRARRPSINEGRVYFFLSILQYTGDALMLLEGHGEQTQRGHRSALQVVSKKTQPWIRPLGSLALGGFWHGGLQNCIRELAFVGDDMFDFGGCILRT